MSQRLYKIIADVFGVESSRISNKTVQMDIDNWDSLNTLILLDRIEREYNVKFSLDDITEITSVRDILNILKSHKVDVT